MKTLAERLAWARDQKSARDQMNFTQADLAARAGVSQSAVGHMESGRTGTSRKMTALAAALGVSVRWLADGDGEPFPHHPIQPRDTTWIQRVNAAEAHLLTLYRGTDDDGRGAITETAELSPQVELPQAANDKP